MMSIKARNILEKKYKKALKFFDYVQKNACGSFTETIYRITLKQVKAVINNKDALESELWLQVWSLVDLKGE